MGIFRFVIKHNERDCHVTAFLAMTIMQELRVENFRYIVIPRERSDHTPSFRGSNATVGIFLFVIKHNERDCHEPTALAMTERVKRLPRHYVPRNDEGNVKAYSPHHKKREPRKKLSTLHSQLSTFSAFLLAEVLVEERYGLHTLVELCKSVTLVR